MKKVVYYVRIKVKLKNLEECDAEQEYTHYREALNVVKKKVEFEKKNGYRDDVECIIYAIVKSYQFYEEGPDILDYRGWVIECEEVKYCSCAKWD